MSQNYNDVQEVKVIFKDGSVSVSRSFDMEYEARIEMAEGEIKWKDKEIKRLEALVAKKTRDDQWVTIEKYNALLKDYQFQETRLKHFAEAIMDTRMGFSNKIDELEKALAKAKASR